MKTCNAAYGIDCSGFTTWVFIEAGVTENTSVASAPSTAFWINPTAGGGIKLASGLSWQKVERNDVQAGDILVRRSGSTGHVGIAYDNAHQIDFGCAKWMEDCKGKVPQDIVTRVKGKFKNPDTISGYTTYWRVVGDGGTNTSTAAPAATTSPAAAPSGGNTTTAAKPAASSTSTTQKQTGSTTSTSGSTPQTTTTTKK